MTREEAIMAVKEVTGMSLPWNDRHYEALQMAIKALEEPERKTGRWMPDNNNYYEERYICSACGKSYKVDTCMGKPMWQFCPCGAKMEDTTNG